MIEPRVEKVNIDCILLKEDPSFSLVRLGSFATLRRPCIKDDGTIITGKFKIQAYKQLNQKEIECDVYPCDLEPEQYHLVRIFNELKSDNLHWADRVRLELEAHKNFQALYGISKKGPGNKGGWGIKDTAQALNIAIGKMNEDANLARALEINPNLAKETRDTAKRIYNKEFKQVIVENEPIVKIESRALYGKPELILRDTEPSTFHACLLSFASKQLDEWLADFICQIYKVLRKDSFLYIIHDIRHFSHLEVFLTEAGFKVQSFPIIAYREELKLRTLSWEYYPNYQAIMLAVKGDPALLAHEPAAQSYAGQYDLVKILLNHCTLSESNILGDMFIVKPCIDSHRSYLAMESDKNKYIDACVKAGIDPHEHLTYKYT